MQKAERVGERQIFKEKNGSRIYRTDKGYKYHQSSIIKNFRENETKPNPHFDTPKWNCRIVMIRRSNQREKQIATK